MVWLTLVDGNKGIGDTLVLITACNEPLSLHELLFILKHYFDSENSYYPVSEGYLGKGMLLSAINCVAVGVPLDTVLKKFKLHRKAGKLNIIDRRKTRNPAESSAIVVNEKTKLAELM